MWHMSGTVKMGKPEKPDTCVDKDCKVLGVQGLRVVDMSVAPLLPRYSHIHSVNIYPNVNKFSAHTQAVAYFIGATAADKIIAEQSVVLMSCHS